MTLRNKLSFMLSVFLLVIAVLAGGAILIISKLGFQMASLANVSEETKLLNEFERNTIDFVEAARDWGMTGESTFRKKYYKKISDIKKNFEALEAQPGLKNDLGGIKARMESIREVTKRIIEEQDPTESPDVPELIRSMDAAAIGIVTQIDVMQGHSLQAVSDVVLTAENTKKRMILYHSSLIAFSAAVATLLFISIRRAIAGPFNEILKATETISKGDLTYRIGMRRSDEFGIVAGRFDEMVAELESSSSQLNRKLKETELLLEIAKVAGTTLEYRDTLRYIIDTIAGKMHYGSCSIYILNESMRQYYLEATNNPNDLMMLQSISQDSELARRLCMTMEPYATRDSLGGLYGESGVREEHESSIIVPIGRDNRCIGIIAIRNKPDYIFSDDESNMLKIIAHTVSSATRNSELYQAARQQAEKMTVLFGLSRAVTSLLDLDALLGKIAEEISRLVSSRGCIIRLIDNNMLKIVSSYGLERDIEQTVDLSLGQGIPGWVAEHGEPLLVEDAEKMPETLKTPGLDIKTAVCVPLKAGEAVIGTLAIYDKLDSHGTLIPFSPEDLNTVEGFATISAIAIEKAKIYEREVNRQREALEEKKRLNILFDSVQGGIITLDQKFMITSANKYVEEWIGLAGSELIGKDSQEIFHGRIGICPHCASKSTFETGEINTITQSRGVNYAELTAYPIRDEANNVTECVIFIMDITERVLYQEETLNLYREVIQTKEYLESIIDNSADAIVTSDIDGLITSWNQGAERTFGFVESEVIGRLLPFVPDFLLEKERANIERLKQGEILKDIETLRRKKDGSIIEVSLTLSPIKDAAGDVIGICGISRDISEKKRVEKELIRRNQEMSRLFFISSAMRSTLELDKLLRMVLTAVTMSDGMGFNRAILFLIDEERNTLKGMMGVGPATPEEAWQVWDDLSLKHKNLDDIMQEIVTSPVKKDSFLERLTVGIELSLDEKTILTQAVKDKVPYNVLDVKKEPLSDAVLIQQLGTQAYAVVPLISRDKVIGLIWVDNYFNRKLISDEDMQFLASFSNQIASAIESARLFEQVAMAEQQLENIFESMSDMVYFNSSDYVIKRINRAVMNRLGRPANEILGKKCYELFHGTTEPYRKCPHHKTVTTKMAYIEELEDPHLGGTFLTSSSPIFDSAGEFIGSVHVVRDITELKQLQKKLVMTEKMAALGEVAAKVAHEIRNPLVSVGGFAKRLEAKLDGNLREYAGIIVKEVSRLEDILREILGFVKEVRLAKEPVNLNALLDDIIRLMGTDIEEQGVNLQKEYQEVPDTVVDPNRVKEAIVNIIKNALQSLTGAGTLTIRTYRRDDEVVLEVQDTGRGIPESDISSIFNPFFTTKTSGTGLGLAITHRIIQEHNGRIEVESEVDRGTLFKVFLPIKEGMS